jgi:L-malate glycosyltransferase
MRFLADNPADSAAACHASSPDQSHSLFSQPVFLLVNSLETGGTERQFYELARAFQRVRVPVKLGCLQKKGPFVDGIGELAEFPPGGSLYGWKSIQSRLRLARDLRKFGIRVAQSFDFYANLMLIPAARLGRVAAVFGSHRQLGDLLTPAQFSAQLAAFRMCDRVVCNSQAAADRLRQAGLSERKLVIIGNALPLEAFAASPPALPRVESRLRVGMIARMNAEYKNHRGFLRAAARLNQSVSNVEFVLVGDGPLRAELEQEVMRVGLEGRVRFLGDRRDIAAVLASLDASVIPSVSESMPNVMLESMAAGVPVVATSVGGNCELGGNGRAVLVPVNDEPGLTEGIARVLADKAFRVTMASDARDFVRANYSTERIREQYENLYEEVLEERGARPDQMAPVRPRRTSKLCTVLIAPTLRYVGGQAVQADLLTRNWKDDPEIDVHFVPIDPRFPMGLGWAERIPVLRTLVRTPLYIWTLWRNLKDVDIAHIFSASYSSFLLAPLPAWAVARLRGKRTLINYRSGEARDHLRRSRIARAVLKRTNRIVTPSRYLVDVFRGFGIEAQVIPNIVDANQISFRQRCPLRPHLVCTRGFHTYYCVDVVVRAFADVQKVFPEARLDLVGGGDLEAEIRRLVRDLRLTAVEFKGVIPREEIGRYYDQADIFINASRLDNMPVSVLEAFASGMPVVTTEPEGMSYIVEHERTGLLSPVGDFRALAKNVIRVLQDPQLAERLILNARAEMKRYAWPPVREQWLQVYRAMAKNGHS